MSMRTQLKKFFTSAAGHHTLMAKAAEAAMNECEEGPERHSFKAAMESHIGHAECCAECAGAMDKADGGGGDELEVLPAGFSKLATTAPHLRAIPRYGAPELPASVAADPVYRAIFESEDEAR
jgi:hypothetical protein